MEDDDEFGDLYTDVLRPFETSLQSQPDVSTPIRSRPIDPDVNSDDDEILDGAPNFKNSTPKSASDPGIPSNDPIHEKTLQAQPESRRLDSNSEKGEGARLPEDDLNFTVEEDDDLNIVVEEREIKEDDDVSFFEKPENVYGVVGQMGSNHMIPGLLGKVENPEVPNFEDEWDSDESEDDLQIVLNDNNHGPMGMMERIPGVDGEGEVDEDGERLVIVADNGDAGQQQPMLDEQEWKGEPGADGERKDPSDASKPGGVPLKIGYSNHLYHHPFHSQFKYVRPGAAPSPGAVPATPGGIQTQVRPPLSMGPGAGRGRVDWRPRGPVPMQKGIHPGNGMPARGPNTAGRGYGSGLDFTLPSHKTIFEVDIDGFEEKPWRIPGIDVSAFFNFGFIEDSWKDYCKQLELLRVEKTMQGKIHVYESGRNEQDYNREFAPELAAAVGNQDVPSENANAGIAGEGSSDLARTTARVPPPLPIGRPIPVETGSDDRRERLPSIDTRRPRMHDSDAIIEIVCQSSKDDDVAEQPESDSDEEDLGGPEDNDDLRRDDLGGPAGINRDTLASNDRKREIVAKREKLVSHDEIDRQGEPPEMRSTKGRGQAEASKIISSDDDDRNDDDDDGEKQSPDNQNEFSDGDDSHQNPHLSSSRATEPNKDQSMVAAGDDDVNGRSFDTDREDITTIDAPEDGKLVRRPPNKQTVLDSRAEQTSQENYEGEEDSKASRSIDERSRDSGKRRAGDEDKYRTKSRPHVSGKEREGSLHSQRDGNSSSLHRHVKSENTDWRKRIRERGGDIGSGSQHSRSQLDKGSKAGSDYDQDKVGSRQRDRDVAHNKRRKEHGEKEEVTYNHREGVNSSHRKRERDDDMNHHVGKKKEEVPSNQKERGRDEWHNRSKQSREDILKGREREETRPLVRSTRPVEDKKLASSQSRGRDDYKGSGREHRSENVTRHGDQLKRRERVEDDVFSRSGGKEKPGTSDGHRQEGSRKGKESESGEQSSVVPSKRTREEQSTRISEAVNPRGITKGTNVESDNHASRQSSRKHTRETPSDGDTTTDSRRGRSKLERWTSHLERDIKPLSSCSLKKANKGSDIHSSSGEAPLPSRKVEEDDKDASGGEKTNANAKAVESNNSNNNNNNNNIHLDTVERLKKRSERFKLPMPSEKEASAIKKIVAEPLPSSAQQTESHPDSEIKIKPERPARKRRWTGN